MKLLEFVVFALTLNSVIRAMKITEIIPSNVFNDAEVKRTACTRNLRRNIVDVIKSTKCKPRETLIKLVSDPGYSLFPNIAVVKRCSGLCSQNFNCFPTKIRMKEVLVKRNSLFPSVFESVQSTCQIIYVKEPIECGCECKVMQHHCSKRQVYNADKCMCECKNEEYNMKECNAQENMMWDRNECKCNCIKTMEECTTGLEWVPSICKCAKVMMDWHSTDT